MILAIEKFNESEEAGLLKMQQWLEANLTTEKRIASFPLLLICPLKEEILGKQYYIKGKSGPGCGS